MTTTGATTPKERPIIMQAESVRRILAGEKTQTRRVLRVQPPPETVCVEPWIIDGEWETRESGIPLFVSTERDGTNREYGCPYGRVGDVLWVREAFRLAWTPENGRGLYYFADDSHRWQDRHEFDDGNDGWDDLYSLPAPRYYDKPPRRTRPSIHMPRWASRLLLEITDIRVQRVAEISEEDARAEGIEPNWAGDLAGWNPDEHGFLPPNYDPEDYNVYTAREAFSLLWDSINGKREGASWADSPWCWAISFRRIQQP